MGSLYCHNPYDKNCLAQLHRHTESIKQQQQLIYANSSSSSHPAIDELVLLSADGEREDEFDCVAPILHQALIGCVSFVPYPTAPIPMPETDLDKSQLTRLFIGQLPYHVTDMQLQWLCDLFAGRREVYHTERIIKWNEAHQPKGCVHTYCLAEDAEAIMAALSKKVLFDDGGVWYANNAAEGIELRQYCDAMKQDKSMRFRERPYQPVVVQLAHSTFVPRSATPPPAMMSATMPPPSYQRPPQYSGVVSDVPSY